MKWIHIVTRFIFHIFWLLPIKKNRIIFTSYKGAQFSCNPKYIFLELYRSNKENWEFIWCLNDRYQLPQEFEDVKTVSYKSFKYIYYQVTSKIVIINHANPVYIPLRRKQLKINTWHGGGAYKRVSLAVKKNKHKFEEYKAKCEIKDTDYFISSSMKFTDVMLVSQMLPKSVYLNIGMPRNDLFFNRNDELILEIKNGLMLEKHQRIVLYAPTYRGGQNSERFEMQLDASRVISCLRKKCGGEWVLLLRTHISTVTLTSNDSFELMDVSSYPDMQELLLVSDVLITDYSSSIWDYALMGKPAFLFTPDLQEYLENRGLYIPIENWQYPHAETNDELINIIQSYKMSENKRRINKYFEEMGSYEKGTASITICKLIKSAL